MELGPPKRNDCLRNRVRSLCPTLSKHDAVNRHLRTIGYLPRTNNATEGWHNAFNSMVSVAHPTAGRLARKLQQEQHSSAIKRNQLQTGQAHPKKSKTYQRVDAAIKTIVAQYSSEDQLTYLRNIARVVNINVT